MFFPSSAFSQIPHAEHRQHLEQFVVSLAAAKMEFLMPEGYKPAEIPPSMYTPVTSPKIKTLGLVKYFITHKEHDIVVGFTPIPYLEGSPEDTEFILGLSRAVDPSSNLTAKDVHFNNVWKNASKAHIDTSIGFVQPIDVRLAKEINADTAVVFPMKIDKPLKERYTKCKYLLLHRDYAVDCRIYFFYREGIDEELVDKEIIRTWGMITFRNEVRSFQ